MNNKSSTALATETSVGNKTENTDITPLAARAGLPYQTTLSSALAGLYGGDGRTPFLEQLRLYDLVWATRATLTGYLPADSVQTDYNCVRYCFSFASYRDNPIDPDTCSVVAELRSDTEPGKLHLSLPGERHPMVLLVEDDADLADLMRLMLEQEGYQTLIADTGRKGVLVAELHLPDLILLDIDLPDISGFEVFRLLKNSPATSRIPIVFCSGRLDASERAKELCAAGCLRKPEDFQQLVQYVRRVLTQA